MMPLAHCLPTLLNILAAISSGFAAYYWHQASKGDPPTILPAKSFPLGEPGKPNTFVDAKELVEWAQNSSKRNMTAARWSMVAAGCAGLSWFVGLWPYPLTFPSAAARPFDVSFGLPVGALNLSTCASELTTALVEPSINRGLDQCVFFVGGR
jgi:hypothetical protein